MAKPKLTLRERFEAKYVVDVETMCWVWTAGRNRKNYGQILDDRGAIRRANRVSWQLHCGRIPYGLQVLHKCDNPPCVNPAHLFLGTNQDNVDDKMRKGRHNPVKGESNNAILTEGDVLQIRKLASSGETQYSIARRYGVNQGTISRVVLRKNWKHITRMPDEYINYAARKERKSAAVIGTRNPKAVFTEEDVREMRRLHAVGFTNKKIVQMFKDKGAKTNNVSMILLRNTWKHI